MTDTINVPRELLQQLTRIYEAAVIDEAHWTDMDEIIGCIRALLTNRASQQPNSVQFEKPSLLTDTNVGYAAGAGDIRRKERDE